MSAEMDALALEAGHVPVMLDPVLELLRPQPGMVYLDCTVGRAGHALEIARRVAPGGRVIALDLDRANVDFSWRRLGHMQAGPSALKTDVVHANFAAARTELDNLNVVGVDLLLADLGFSSNQMDDPSRGMSFAADGPLDMRMDRQAGASAADLVNRLHQRELADLLFRYGEERLSRKIARKIIERRAHSPIVNSSDLAQLVRGAYGSRAGRHKINPATRTFMALRIAVNQELEALERLLDDLPRLLNPGGRAAIISFHSLEDRRVKIAFTQYQHAGLGQRLTRKPLVSSDTERARNPRSRSAKLRAIELGQRAQPVR